MTFLLKTTVYKSLADFKLMIPKLRSSFLTIKINLALDK
jgi:hypothetical protein